MIHIVPYKPLARCSIDELAAQQRINDLRRLTSGVSFARKDDDAEKQQARLKVLALLSPDTKPGPVSVLTMPGINWHFEAQLLKAREPHWRHQTEIDRTRFTCVENDRFVYYSAATKMPGNKHCTIRSLDRPQYAERAMGHGIVDRFIFANVDDLMQDEAERFDVAWLDYTGPLTVERMRIIQRFWSTSISDTLIVTALKARWNKATSLVVDRHGGCLEWMLASLPGRVLHAIEYQDGSPMVQLAVTKAAS